MARKKCLKLLEYAPRTRMQLEKKLSEAGFSPAAVRDAVDYAAGYGYVDDSRYAAEYIRSRVRKKSLRQLAMELKEKGVPAELIDLSKEEFREEEQQAVRRVAAKRAASKPFTDEESVYRLIQYLTGKGFSYADAKAAAWELWEQRQ